MGFLPVAALEENFKMEKRMNIHSIARKTCLILFAALTGSLGASELITYDYIIVGNGTAGAVLARKLSDDKKAKILVLEAGANHSEDPNVLDASGVNLLSILTELTIDPKYAQTYGVAAVFPLQFITYSEGRGWGGSSAHNYLEAIRGSPWIYNGWATLSGSTQWSYNNLLPLMKAIETYTPDPGPPNTAQRGTSGPISITQTGTLADLEADTLAQDLAITGTNNGFIEDINDPTAVSTTGHTGLGFAPYQMFATPGATLGTVGHRSFSSNSFLPSSVVSSLGKATDGRLLRIESNASVSRVLFNGKKAIGVEFVYGTNENQVLQAYGKKIILCAGGINSAAILQRSGIGDANLLNSLGIDVLVDNPNVGANLINQYGAGATVAVGTTVTPFLQGFVNGACATPFSAPFDYPDDNTRRIQFAAAAAGPSQSLVFAFILEPKSRGSVQIVSANPLIQPKVSLNCYSDGGVETQGTDANLVVDAYYLIANGVGSGNMISPPSGLFAQPPGDVVQDATLLAIAQNGIIATSHILGTTAMGTSIQNGVVDGNLQVFGVQNLMVADLGVAPVSPDGNTCFAVYVIGLNAARILGAPVPPAL